MRLRADTASLVAYDRDLCGKTRKDAGGRKVEIELSAHTRTATDHKCPRPDRIELVAHVSSHADESWFDWGVSGIEHTSRVSYRSTAEHRHFGTRKARWGNRVLPINPDVGEMFCVAMVSSCESRTIKKKKKKKKKKSCESRTHANGAPLPFKTV